MQFNQQKAAGMSRGKEQNTSEHRACRSEAAGPLHRLAAGAVRERHALHTCCTTLQRRSLGGGHAPHKIQDQWVDQVRRLVLQRTTGGEGQSAGVG